MTVAVLSLLLFVLAGCSPRAPSPEENANAGERLTFVNRVWKVSESDGVEPGQLYVFLSEGTLVIASPHGKPSLGTWTYKDGALTMVEEGLAYKIDILELSRSVFRIRSNNPDGAVEIRLVPAEESAPPG